MSNLIFDSVTKIFGEGGSKYVALENINFEAESGQLILVVGPSGSGKTTFLTIAGGLQTPTNGDVKINDSTINSLSKKQQTKLRLEKIGFILQSYNLVPFLTVEEQFKFVDKLKKQNFDKLIIETTQNHMQWHSNSFTSAASCGFPVTMPSMVVLPPFRCFCYGCRYPGPSAYSVPN